MARRKKIRLNHPPHQKFKAFLVENKIKQKEIAELLKLSPVTINQKINGTLHFSWNEVEIICNIYKLDFAIFKTL